MAASAQRAVPTNRDGAKFCSECGSRRSRSPAPPAAPPHAGTEVLRRVRRAARHARPAARAGAGAGGRAPPRLGPVRRPGRLHDALRSRATPRRCASSSRATSTRAARVIELLRRHGREVHRRRRDGGLGHAGRARRTTPSGPFARRSISSRRSSALGDEVGAPDLRARAGVLTGEAAVTLGAEGQGMVAGDLVNTASRVQSAADPGRCSSARRPAARPSRRSPTRTRARTS